MSFGYGAGDFLSVLLFANEIRRRFVYAPTHFKNTTERIKSLSNVLRDIEDIDPENALSKSQRHQLEDISRSCCGVLQELHHLLARYQNLEMDSTDPKATRGPRHFSRRAWQRLKWDPKEIETFEQRIQGQVAIFNLFMSRLNMQVNLAACETTTRTRYEIAAIKHFHSNDEFDKVLDWLSPVNYAAQQNDLLNQQQPGSGQWLLGASQFRGWLEGNNQTLFCPGIPGSGKTIMVSMIIDYLERAFNHDGNIGIAYLYCSFRRRPSQTFRDLLASVVRQLVQRSLEIPDSVRTAYSQSRNKKIQPSVSELLQFLQAFSAQLSRVFIVVDALDECESTARESFIAAIYDLQNEHNVNFLATSRYIPDTIAAFEACPTLEIRATMEDVWRYLRSQLSRLPSFVSRNKELQCEIIAEVSKAVGGMFLLAKLHLDSLVGKRSQKAVRTALKSLPSGSNAYDSAYSTAMERIEGQVSDQRDMAKQVLSWITCAGPLTTRQLQHALAVEVRQPYLDEANISDVEDIVSVCAGLVIVDEQSNIIRLVHYTAQEYFERTWSSWFPCAQHDIAVTCITYLSYDSFKDYSSHSNHEAVALDKYPLYRYAAQNWGRHGQIQRHYLDIVLDFLGNKQKATCAAQVLLEDRPWPIPIEIDGIHLASYFGLDDTVYHLVATGCDINSPDSLGKSPLSWAACEGHVSLVQLLLDLGASRDSMDTNWQTPLSWAAKTGHRDVVELLVNLGADKQSRDKYGQSPLSLAARYGQRAVVECLLKAGADIDSRDNNGQTALLWAASQDHPDIVKLLLESGDKPENDPVLSWSTTTVNEKDLLDTLKFEDCEKDDPLTSGRNAAGNGRLMEARPSPQNGPLVIPLPGKGTDEAVVDW